MSTTTFSLGDLVVTAGIASVMSAELSFHTFVYQALHRHHAGDWGELCLEDQQSNDSALQYGGRLFSVYDTAPIHQQHGTRIYIVTEHDRSVTTVLWPREY